MSTQDSQIERVQAMRLEAGDLLVLKCNTYLTKEKLAHMRETISSMVPEGVYVLITDPRIELVASAGKVAGALSEDEEEIAMIDAAMLEMANIDPPLKRSECRRLIRAAMGAAQ